MHTKNLPARDRACIWHPYTQMQTAELPIAISHAKDATLYTTDGKSYLDAISSWWVTLHGHANEYIAQKVYQQLQTLEHVIFAGFTHPSAVLLCERLLEILPSNQQKLFFSDNGSTAVEVGLKMAFQYWYNQNINKTKVLAFKNAYHGDTFGAMAVSGRSAFTAPFAPFLFDVVYIDVPHAHNAQACFEEVEQLVAKGDVAAFVFEPLVQGAGGMIMYEPAHLDRLLSICKANKVITIADEVMTGFGRTGKLFACDYLQQQPDIMCLSKGLTGGTMPMSLTSCAQYIYDAFLSTSKLKTFFHGHSYTANPVACAAALASLDILLSPDCNNNIQNINRAHVDFQALIVQHPKVKSCRVRGTILAVEYVTNEATSYLNSKRDFMAKFCLSKGVLLRPLGNVLYVLPPYCISATQLQTAYKTMHDLADAL